MSRPPGKEPGARSAHPSPEASREAGLGVAERVRRAGSTGAALGKIWLGYKGIAWLERTRFQALGQRARRRWDDASARTVRDTALRLGGLLVKAGQFAGARPDMIPAPFTRHLARLHDRVPAHPFPVVREIVRRELGADPDDLFARFWRRPLASASLAQVHRATLADGRDVAVKVQRPEIGALVDADLKNLKLAVAAFERVGGDRGLRELLEHLQRWVPRELDFRREARAAERLRACFAGRRGIWIPAVLPRLSTARVLVTEFVPGIRVDQRRRLERARIDRHALVARLVEAYAAQILQHGLFHADPHPGNLLALPDDTGARLAFVDFGLVEELPAAFRANLAALAAPLLAGDAEATARVLARLGVRTQADDPEAGARAAELLLELVRRKREATPGVRGDLAAELGELMQQSGLRLPPELWLIARVLGLIWGVAAALDVQVDLFEALGRTSRESAAS